MAHRRRASDTGSGGRWTRLGAYALCRDDEQRILLTRASPALAADAGAWLMPGGGVEWGEDPSAAVLRELEEETGLTGTLGGVRGVWSWVLPANLAGSGDPGHLVGIVYEVADLRGELRDEVDGSTDQAAWFTLDEARALPRSAVNIVDFCLDLC